jgi:hypothetical protein
VDRKKELRKLNHSILLNFLDLVDILIKVNWIGMFRGLLFLKPTQ